MTMVGSMAAAPAAVAVPVVSACAGPSLPASRLTGVVTPLVNGIFTDLNLLGVGGLLGAVGAPAVINSALSGAPIGLDVLTTSGAVLAPGTPCAQQADGFTIATPKGITIGGNSIDGLGANGLSANAGELGSIALGNSAATNAGATNSIAIGTSAAVTGNSPNAIAIGNGAMATTTGSVALGGAAMASGASSVAVGPGATSAGPNSVASGVNSSSGGFASVAIGNGANAAQNEGVALGESANASAGAGIAVGVGATASAQSSLAVGGHALASAFKGESFGDTAQALGSFSLALGANTLANNGNDVALGAGSITAAPNIGATATGVTLNGVSTTFAGLATPAAGVVSVGVAGSERQINNVAAGDITADSTDAVNGSELFATNAAVSAVGATAANSVQYDDPGHTSVTLGGVGAPTTVALTNVSPGALNAGSTDAVNGSQLNALGTSIATNLGGGSVFDPVSGQATAPGYTINGATYNDVGSAFNALTGGGATAGVMYFHANSIGPDSSALGLESVAIGSNAIANNPGDVALGFGASTAAAVATPTVTIGGTTYGLAGAAPTSVVSVGAPGAERQITNVAAGQISADSTDVVNGSELFATNAAVSAVGATAANSVQYDDPGHTSVTLGGVGAPTTVALTNVSPGALNASSTDAVNGSQLFTTNSNVTDLTNNVANGAIGTVQYTPVPNQLTLVAPGGSGAAPGVAQNLTNLANGAVTAASTDAVNGSQLFGSNATVSGFLGGGANVTNGTAPTYTVAGTNYNDVGSALSAITGGSAASGVKYFHANSTGPDSNPIGIDSVAIGANAVANNTGDIALGSGSTTGATVATPNALINGDTYTFAGGAPSSTVSIGGPDAERTLTNVAAGRLTAASTDAVNGSQLFATNTALNAIGATADNSVQYDNPGHTSVTLGGEGPPVALNNVAAAALTPGSTGAVNGGQINTLGASEATNLGGGATFDPVAGTVTAPAYTVAGNTYNNVGSAIDAITGGSAASGVKYFHANSTGPDSNPIGIDSVAIGANAVANNTGDIALGSGSTTGATVATPNALINGDTYTFAGGAPSSTVSIGGPDAERTLTNVAAGRLTAASTDAVNGSQLFATNTALNAIGATADNSVQYDNPGHTSVTLGGEGPPVALNNVAAAALTPGSTGAVNGGQINTLGASEATNLGGGATFDPVSGTVTAPSYTVANIGAGGTVGAPNTATTVGGAIDGLSTDVTNLAGGIANGTAGLVQQTGGSPGAGQITVGAGTQGTSVTFANSTGASRTLTGVSPGALNATSTDAVNGSQAFAAGTTTATNLGGGSTFDATTGNVTAPSYTVQGANYNNVGSALAATDGALTTTNTNVTNLTTGKVGAFVSDNSVTAVQPVSSGANALAGGFGATATGAGSAVVGNGATDNGVAGSTVLGQGASVAAGLAGSNVALGQGSTVTTGAQTGYAASNLSAPQTSIGDVSVGTAGGARQVSGVAAGSAPNDAVNVAQLTSALLGVQYGVANPVQYDDSTHKSVTLGNAGTPVTVSNVAAGTLSPTSTQAVNGSQLYATNTIVNSYAKGGAGAFQVYQSGTVAAPTASAAQSTAGGDGAVASGAGSTAIGYHASSTGNNSVALGAGSTDGGQANVVSLGAPGAERRLTNVAPGVNGTDGVNLNQLNLLAGAFDNSIQAVIRQEQAGDAVALAASGLRYDERPGTSSIAGGASYYSGHEGIAFGLGHTSSDGNWRYNIAASFVTPEDRADVGVIAGVSYTFAH